MLLGASAFAEPPEVEAPKLAGESLKAFIAGDYVRARELLARQIELQPDQFVPRYNMACTLAKLGERDAAVESLVTAVERGFADVHQLRRDDALDSLRELPAFRRLLDAWPEIMERRITTDLERAKADFSGSYNRDRDARMRLAYMSSYDEKTTLVARRELDRIGAWAERELFPGLFAQEQAVLDAWVLVVLPKRRDFGVWALQAFGPAAAGAFSSIGGAYEHDRKRLVAQDLGATLRHEFLHVLHWRHMNRLGQIHPIWIQEGLCSVVEDFDAGPGESDLTPVVSWRTNIAKRVERGDMFLTLEKLGAMPHERFMNSRPLANYAQARAVFMFLAANGKLGAWYRAYTEGFGEDPSGVKAFERVFGEPIAAVNKRYRTYVRTLPDVPEEIATGMASLGIEIESAEGDGLRVVNAVKLRKRIRTKGGADAEVPDLRIGDIIRAIQSRPTRDMAELVRVLGSFQPGETVEIEYRRGRLMGVVSIELVAKE
jgi:hypothetical protein